MERFSLHNKNIEEIIGKFQIDKCRPIVILMTLNEKLKKDDSADMSDAKKFRSLVGSLT